MKKLLILLVIISTATYSQDAARELQNIHNDKYLEKYNYQNNNEVVVCESNRGRRTLCRVDTRFGVNIIKQLSRQTCNYNWGYDSKGIWVDNGCIAEFSVNRGWDQPGSESNIMVCESRSYRRNYCPAYLNGRDVFLLKQISQLSCQNNWGYDQNGVWVANGCRAEFAVEDRYNNNSDVVVCSSRNLRLQACQVDTSGGVEFLKQLSRASCNGNWGYDRQGIWVNNGCRAKFRVLPSNRGYGNYEDRDTVTCSSKNSQMKICRADTSGGVRLIKQKSRASCRGNWGYKDNSIWVDNGCRATFQLYIDGNRNNYGQGSNNSQNSENINYGNNRGQDYGNNNYGNYSNQNSKITCSSRHLRRATCEIPRGSKVKILRQLSNTSCSGSWGYNRDYIWVDKGCRAEFRVY